MENGSKVDCLSCKETDKRDGPEPTYRVVLMVVLWTVVASVLSYHWLIRPIAESGEIWIFMGVGVMAFIALILLIRWLICNPIGLSLTCFRDHKGEIHVHNVTESLATIFESSKRTGLRLRIGGYFRQCWQVHYGCATWTVECWDGRRLVTARDHRDGSFRGTPQEVLAVVEEFQSVGIIILARQWQRDARLRLGAAVVWAVNEAFLDRQRSQRSLAAMRLRRQMMKIVSELFSGEELRELQQQVGIDKDLVVKWGDEIRALEDKVAAPAGASSPNATATS